MSMNVATIKVLAIILVVFFGASVLFC
ncbi:hypothetical protein LCGC14_2708150, partial [marine sediment metagenome]